MENNKPKEQEINQKPTQDDNQNIDEVISQSEQSDQPKDNRSWGEKIEDSLDDFMYNAQNALMGERKSLEEDIPATMEIPSGIRKINKVQTRKNISRKFFGWKGLKILFLVALGLGIFSIIISIISLIFS